MTEPEICTLPMPTHFGGRCCGRLLSDPCGFCIVFDKYKDEWFAVFNEYRDTPRVAVEGDI